MSVVLKLVLLGVTCLVTASLIGGGVYWHHIRSEHLKSLQSHKVTTTAPPNATTILLNTTTPLNTPPNTTTEANDHHPVESVNLPNAHTETESSGSKRSKRAIIFRPLFVYRQQEIKKQRLKDEREQRWAAEYYATSTTTTTTTPRPPQRPKYASYYPYVPNTLH